MFLNHLSHPWHKLLFIELSVLMMMAGTDNENNENVQVDLRYYRTGLGRNMWFDETMLSNKELSILLAYISSSEMKMLGEYVHEFRKQENNPDYNFNLPDLLEDVAELKKMKEVVEKDLSYSTYGWHETDFMEFCKKFNFSESQRKVLLEYKSDCMENSFDWYREDIPSFYAILQHTCNHVLEVYNKDQGIKKEVMRELMENGEDILDLTPDKVRYAMINLPVVRKVILENAAFWVVAPKQKIMGLKFSEQDKKIILCELVGAGFSSGALKQAERDLLQVICQLLEIDIGYIDKFSEVMSKLFVVNHEFGNLIGGSSNEKVNKDIPFSEKHNSFYSILTLNN